MSIDDMTALQLQRSKQERQRENELFLIRSNFKEPSLDGSSPPEWLRVLRERKKEACKEQEALRAFRWVGQLERQLAVNEKLSLSESAGGEGAFNCTWMRHLSKELEERE
jgi:hypothetical protein